MLYTEWGGQPWEQAAVVAATADDTVRTSVYDRIRALHLLMGSLIACSTMPSSTTGWDEALRQQLADAAQRADAGVVNISVGIVRDAAQLLRDRAAMCLRDVDGCARSIDCATS